MRSLVIGMGIGELYKRVLDELRHEIVTVDTQKPADFTSVDAAIDQYDHFDLAFICTPNYTHEQIAYKIASKSHIVFVEKPGVISADHWQILHDSFPNTKFMMVKNNQYRDEIAILKNLINQILIIDIRWINYNRIPNPGSWFTNKKLAFGGVNRDLMPHLLSIVTAILPESYMDYPIVLDNTQKTNWQLKDVLDTDYGTVDPNGVYDVDDYSRIHIKIKNIDTYLTADWRSKKIDDQSLQVILNNHQRMCFNLGLCPEKAYKTMIQTALYNSTNKQFWQDQLAQDLWIHKMIS
jgi:predicted dehydrogenase